MVALACFAVALVGPIVRLRMSQHAGETVEGQVGADRTPIGTFAFAVNGCASGQAFAPSFFGVDLRGGRAHDLRVDRTGDDAQLWLYPRGASRGAISIVKRDCSAWDVAVAPTRLPGGHGNGVSGHVGVRCAVGAGKFVANVRFEHCTLGD